ncbi:unnamed protein product [Rhizoctonia solani]|uniref:Uncharacterized protein n=1 Tax=Rhizoctonia solani TaxID=456999 RepID=A0A8H2X5Q0_9AGAM|nr:unnamed protein product [Rhizoctonia solani]
MNIMETLFGRSVTPAERLRQHQRALAKAQRELDRERTKLEQQEKKLIMDIKKSAKAGQMNAAKIMAKDLLKLPPTSISAAANQLPNQRELVAIGEGADGPASHKPPPPSGGEGGAGNSDEDALQARLDALKKGF